VRLIPPDSFNGRILPEYSCGAELTGIVQATTER
jgi:hypothetical protein